MPPNGVPAVVGKIEIVMLANGNIQAQCTVADRNMFNMMMARCEQDIIDKFKEAEKVKVIAPPPGLDLSTLRGGRS